MQINYPTADDIIPLRLWQIKPGIVVHCIIKYGGT